MKKENTLHEIFDDLFDNLTQNFLFYIPREILPVEVSKGLFNQEFTRLLNRFIVYDQNSAIRFLEDSTYATHNFSKGSLLNNNVFELLSKKQTLEPEEFSFLINKYYEQSETYFYISDWLNQNIDKFMSKKLDLTISGYFLIQTNYLKSHYKNILNHFYKEKDEIPRGSFDVLKTIEVQFPELFKSFKRIEKNNSGPEKKNTNQIQLDNIATASTKLKTGYERKKKVPLISNDEAEGFILEAVFNLKS